VGEAMAGAEVPHTPSVVPCILGVERFSVAWLSIRSFQGGRLEVSNGQVLQGTYMRKFLVLVFVLLVPVGVAAEVAHLTLGVHPYLDAEEIKRRFSPLAGYLSEQLGREVRVHVGIDYDEHINAVGADKLDIAFLGPASYVRLTNQYGSKPILARVEADGQPCFHGYIVAREESPLQHLSDLRGMRFAFGDPESTMGTLVPRDMLAQAGVPLDQLAAYRHLTGHRNVALSVLVGSADAGAVKAEVFEYYRPQGMRSLARTPCISEHLFVTRSDLDADLIVRLHGLLLGLDEADAVGRVLAPIKESASALVPAQDADYDNLREIDRRSGDRFLQSAAQ